MFKRIIGAVSQTPKKQLFGFCPNCGPENDYKKSHPSRNFSCACGPWFEPSLPTISAWHSTYPFYNTFSQFHVYPWIHPNNTLFILSFKFWYEFHVWMHLPTCAYILYASLISFCCSGVSNASGFIFWLDFPFWFSVAVSLFRRVYVCEFQIYSVFQWSIFIYSVVFAKLINTLCVCFLSYALYAECCAHLYK